MFYGWEIPKAAALNSLFTDNSKYNIKPQPTEYKKAARIWVSSIRISLSTGKSMQSLGVSGDSPTLKGLL
jgi:hypothetical protein